MTTSIAFVPRRSGKYSSPLFVRGEGPARADFGEAPHWIPLMLYYTGARVEEPASSMYDIRQELGISLSALPNNGTTSG